MERNKPISRIIVDSIKQDILDGIYSPGDHLPTESKLVEKFSTSRVTVRKALKILCNDKVIYSHQGKGYFVSKPDFTNYSMHFDLFKPELKVEPREVSIIRTSKEMKNDFKKNESGLLLYIKTLFYKKDMIVAYQDMFLPYIKGYPTIESVLRIPHSQEIIKKKLNSYNIQTSIEITPARLSNDVAHQMKCSKDEAVLEVKRQIRNQYGDLLALGKVYLRKDFGAITAISGFKDFE